MRTIAIYTLIVASVLVYLVLGIKLGVGGWFTAMLLTSFVGVIFGIIVGEMSK